MNNPFQSYNRGYTARERRIRRDLGMLLAITGIICVWLAFRTTSQNRTIDELEATNTVLQIQSVKMKNQIDSLKAEGSDKDSLLTKKGIAALINQRDSLRSELFVCNVQLQRWELAFEIHKEREPKSAQRFRLIYNHETE